jgi:hypothetical protein
MQPIWRDNEIRSWFLIENLNFLDPRLLRDTHPEVEWENSYHICEVIVRLFCSAEVAKPDNVFRTELVDFQKEHGQGKLICRWNDITAVWMVCFTHPNDAILFKIMFSAS